MRNVAVAVAVKLQRNAALRIATLTGVRPIDRYLIASEDSCVKATEGQDQPSLRFHRLRSKRLQLWPFLAPRVFCGTQLLNSARFCAFSIATR